MLSLVGILMSDWENMCYGLFKCALSLVRMMELVVFPVRITGIRAFDNYDFGS